MDPFDAAKRSEIMSHIRGKDTDVEKKVRSLLHSLGYRFRLHVDGLPGKPDIVLPKYASIVFVHGCFWHRHRNCPDARMPKSRIDFWSAKFEDNVRRDREVKKILRMAGWRIFVVWECESEIEFRIKKFMEV